MYLVAHGIEYPYGRMESGLVLWTNFTSFVVVHTHTPTSLWSQPTNSMHECVNLYVNITCMWIYIGSGAYERHAKEHQTTKRPFLSRIWPFSRKPKETPKGTPKETPKGTPCKKVGYFTDTSLRGQQVALVTVGRLFRILNTYSFVPKPNFLCTLRPHRKIGSGYLYWGTGA